MPRDAIMITTYNRPAYMVEATLRSARAILPDALLVLIDDGSTATHKAAYASLADQYGPGVVRDSELNLRAPGAYSIGGHNNPSVALNVGWRTALDAGCEDILILSSDCIVQSRARQQLREFDTSAGVWTCAVADMELFPAIWHAPQQPRPFNWAMYASLSAVEAIGGWDERFMAGIAFEDNDFSARLLIHTGKLIVRGDTFCWHQSHPQTAYSDGGRGFAINQAACREKWLGFVPINDPDVLTMRPLAVEPHVAAFECYRGPRNLIDHVQRVTDGAGSVVDLGARFGDKAEWYSPTVGRRIAVEIHPGYLQRGRAAYPGLEWHQGDMVEWVRACPTGDVDVALLIDTLEHLDKDTGRALLADCQRKFARVFVFTLDGYIPQEHSAFDKSADHWERHLCGWSAAELEALGFQVRVASDYHRIDGKTYGALFAAWEADA